MRAKITRIKDRELREIPDRIPEKIGARGENGSGGENDPQGEMEGFYKDPPPRI